MRKPHLNPDVHPNGAAGEGQPTGSASGDQTPEEAAQKLERMSRWLGRLATSSLSSEQQGLLGELGRVAGELARKAENLCEPGDGELPARSQKGGRDAR